MRNAPKKTVNQPKTQPSNQRFTPTFDIEQQIQMGGGGFGNNVSPRKTMPQQNFQSKMMAAPRANPKKNIGSSNRMGGGNFSNFSGKSGGFDNQPIRNGGNPMAMMDQGPQEPQYPCPDCGRTFNESVLEKHKKICKKVFQKKRKAFDSRKHRMVDGEQMSLMKYGEAMAKKNPKLNKKAGGIPKWKLQSEEFRSVLKANRGLKMPGADSFGGFGMGGGIGGNLSSQGGSLARYGAGGRGNYGRSNYGGGSYGKGTGAMGKQQKVAFQPSVINNDFTLCQFCNRRYNDEAYAKHLPGCERRFKEAQIRNKITKAPKGNAKGGRKK